MEPLTRQSPHHRQGWLDLFLWLLAALLLGESVWAAPLRVTVLSERDDGAYGTALQTLTETLAVLGGADAPAVESITVADSDPLPRDRMTAARTDLVVTVGSRMADRVMQLRPEVPVLCVLLPEASFNVALEHLDHKERPPPHRFSALYLDQPWARQMRLVATAFPDIKEISVAFGPSSEAQEEAVSRSAEEFGYILHTTHVDRDESPLKGVLRVLQDGNDVLLAIPDPVVYNPYSVQAILLATYRRSVPVVGFSKAYVSAGATVAIYTTPEQVGREAARLILQSAGPNGIRLPPPRHPQEFSVSINHQVARSLGIELPDETRLERLLREQESAR